MQGGGAYCSHPPGAIMASHDSHLYLESAVSTLMSSDMFLLLLSFVSSLCWQKAPTELRGRTAAPSDADAARTAKEFPCWRRANRWHHIAEKQRTHSGMLKLLRLSWRWRGTACRPDEKDLTWNYKLNKFKSITNILKEHKTSHSLSKVLKSMRHKYERKIFVYFQIKDYSSINRLRQWGRRSPPWHHTCGLRLLTGSVQKHQ